MCIYVCVCMCIYVRVCCCCCAQCGLKERLEELVPQKQNEVKEFRQKDGEVVVGKVTVNMVSPPLYCTNKYTFEDHSDNFH